MNQPDYTSNEIMAIAAARRIQNGDIVFCGTGISMVAAMAAKHIHAPDAVIFFETGAVDSALEEVPLAVGDSRVMVGAQVNASLADAFAFMQNRRTGARVVAVLGAAQIDAFGNLNTTCIGDPSAPTTRLAGSGGACDASSLVHRSLIFMKHEKRRFVPVLDYFTSPGWGRDGQSRRQMGLGGAGPEAVVTDLGVMGFDKATRRMFVEGIYPGIDPAVIADRTGFDLDLSRAALLPPPGDEELRILRQRCDPARLIL